MRHKQIEKVEYAIDQMQSGIPVPSEQPPPVRYNEIESAVDRAAYMALQYLQSVIADATAERKERMQAAVIVLRDGSNFLRNRGSTMSEDSVIY